MESGKNKAKGIVNRTLDIRRRIISKYEEFTHGAFNLQAWGTGTCFRVFLFLSRPLFACRGLKMAEA